MKKIVIVLVTIISFFSVYLNTHAEEACVIEIQGVSDSYKYEIGTSLDLLTENVKAINTCTKEEIEVSVNYNEVIMDVEGDYPVYFSAYKDGMFATIVRYIEVTVDATPPIITIPGDITFVKNEEITDDKLLEGVTATDNLDENLSISVDTTPINEEVAGSYTIIYSVTDSHGNKATAERTVIIIEVPKPVIEGLDEFKIEVGSLFVDWLDGVKAYDYADNEITEISVDDSLVNLNQIGTYEVVYRVVDNYQNETILVRIIEVMDRKAPHILGVLTKRTIHAGELFDCLRGVTAYDAYDGDLTDLIESSHKVKDYYEEGEYEIVLSVKDSSGNLSKVTIFLTVIPKDNHALLYWVLGVSALVIVTGLGVLYHTKRNNRSI